MQSSSESIYGTTTWPACINCKCYMTATMYLLPANMSRTSRRERTGLPSRLCKHLWEHWETSGSPSNSSVLCLLVLLKSEREDTVTKQHSEGLSHVWESPEGFCQLCPSRRSQLNVLAATEVYSIPVAFPSAQRQGSCRVFNQPHSRCLHL